MDTRIQQPKPMSPTTDAYVRYVQYMTDASVARRGRQLQLRDIKCQSVHLGVTIQVQLSTPWTSSDTRSVTKPKVQQVPKYM